MAKEVYMPLKWAQAYGQNAELRKILIGFGAEEDTPYDEYIDFANDTYFYTPQYQGPMKNLNFGIMRAARNTMSMFAGETPQSAWKDIISMYGVVGLWSQNKQVYKFDRDFALELSKTESLKLYPELMRRLPYDTFYVDTTDIPEFAPFDGLFVHVKVYPDDSIIVIGHRVVGEAYYTWTNGFGMEAAKEENGYHYFDLQKYIDDFPKTLPLSDPDKKRLGNTVINQENFPAIRMFLFQALTYLASERPDISENALTKKTYKLGTTVKNKFSEIRKWDVGVTFGTAFRKQRSSAKPDAEVADRLSETKSRKSPRPHSRCAHWQHYWIGKGRKELTLKWIQPTFVGAKADGIVKVTPVRKEDITT